MHAHAILSAALLLLGNGSGTRVPSDDDAEATRAGWLDLDRELQTSLAPFGTVGGTDIGAMLRAFYTFSSDDIATLGGDDISGVSLNDVDVWFEQRFGEMLGRVSLDLDEGVAELEDAYGVWRHDLFELRAGQIKPFVLRSNAIDPEYLGFKERTLLGAFFDQWDFGVQVASNTEDFEDSWGWWVSVTDGEDGQEADHRWTARVEFGVYEGGARMAEDTRGNTELLEMTVGGAFVHDDDTGPEDNAWCLDAAFTLGPHAVALEWVDLDDGAGGTIDELRQGVLTFVGDSQPWSATYGMRFAREWQALVRGQVMDDLNDTKAYSAALHWFPGDKATHWQVEVTHYDRDEPEGTLVEAGVVTGLSRPPGKRVP